MDKNQSPTKMADKDVLEMINYGIKQYSPEKEIKPQRIEPNTFPPVNNFHPELLARGYINEVREINKLHNQAKFMLLPKELKKFDHETFFKDKINSNYELIHG